MVASFQAKGAAEAQKMEKEGDAHQERARRLRTEGDAELARQVCI